MGKLISGAAILALILVQGCASVKGGLTPTQHVDLSPFADQTISLVGGGEYSLPESVNAILIRQFFDYQDPDFVKLTELEIKAELLIRRIIAYSIQVVTLSESDKSDEDKVDAYADYLEALKETGAANEWWEMSEEEYRSIVRDIRAQARLLDALRAAQPLVNGINQLAGDLFDEMEMSLSNIVLRIESDIDEEYDEILSFFRIIDSEKKGVLKGLQLLHEYSIGNQEAFEALEGWFGDVDIPGSQDPLADGELSTADMTRLRTKLRDELIFLREVAEQLRPEWETWQELHRELDEVQRVLVPALHRSRLALLIWTRAHHKMAMGVTDPAEWFDVTDPTGELFNMGKRFLLK